MSSIAEAAPEKDPYNRNDYEPSWSAGSGCDIRSRLLSSISLVPVTYGANGCTVEYGKWLDPYEGKTFEGSPHGGDGTALNNGVYLVVSTSENDAKGENGPSKYYPPNPSYRCTYAERWRDNACE